MSSSKSSSSGHVLFQELRHFFDEAARNPVSKGNVSEIRAHWQVVYSVCRATFASSTTEDLWLHTSQILHSLLVEIKSRPAILLHKANADQVLPLETANGQQAPDPPSVLAPWLTAHLLRTVALLLANPSRTLPQQEQQHALEQLHQAIVAIVHATHANTCSEELDALEVTESLIRNLFSFNYDASDPTDGLSFDPTAESQNPSLQERSCVVHFSRAEFRHLEPALFRIQCDLLCKGVGTAHAPELVSSLQKLVDRKCTASVKGKAPEQSPQTRLADCTLCLELASACLTAFIHEATFIPGFNSIMDETNESTTGLDQAFAHFAQTIRLTAQATVSPDLSPRLLSIVDESLTRVIDTVVLFPHSSPELQNVLAALLSLDNPDLDSFPILSEQHRSQLLSLGAAAPSHLTPDLAQSLQALQNYNPSIDDVEPFAFSSSQAPTSARKRKRDQDLALHKTTARQTSWKPQVQALLGLAAPNVQWASHESLDTVLVKVVQRFTESRNREERASLIHSLGLAACARNGTLEWEPATPFHGAFCPHCDDELSGSAPKKSERALRGVALAALLQVLDASQKLELSAEDLRDILRAICRLLQHTKPAAQKVSSGPDVAKTLSSLLDHPDRLVRISSSRALERLLRVASEESTETSSTSQQSGLLVQPLRKLQAALTKSRCLREAALMTLGRLGRWTSDEDLGTVLQMMVSLLGRQGDPVASIAYMQIFNLSKHRKTSPYKLFAPFLPSLSPFIIQQNSASLLDAFSELIGVNRTIFLKQNASHIAPELVLQGKRQSMEHLAAACEMTLPELVAHNAARIVSTLHLTDFQAYRKGTHFMLDLFSSKQTLSGIFESCAAEVLFELVVEWGNKDSRKDLAYQALNKLVTQKVAKASGIDELLGSHLLGILALMNDFLNDLHGRRSVFQKRKALTGLGRLISSVGVAISDVTPQVMATLQSSLAVPDLRLPTLEAWHSFITSLKFTDIGPFVGQTSAALVRVYPDLHRSEQSVANKVLEFLLQHASSLGTYADELADLSTLPGLATLSTSLRLSRPPISFESRLSAILHRIDSDNESVCLRGLCDLELLLGQEVRQMRELSAGDTFNHLLGCVVKSVISSAIRSGDAWPTVRDLAFECLGAIGALDPDRLEIPADKATFVLQNNFAHTEENMEFAVDFIQHVLVRAYQSSNDTKHQSALAYSIQQLLKVCQFTPAMLSTDPAKSASISLSVLNRWKRLPKTVVETLAPLLTSRFEVKLSTSTLPTSRPVYSHKSSYRDWIRDWSLDMINHVISSSAKAIFTSFLSVVKTGDVGIARKLVPHLVLHLVISEQQKEALHSEILEVLQDQVRVTPHLPPEPRLLCAQTIFDTMDHLGQWLRSKSAELNKRRNKYRKNPSALSEHIEKAKAVLGPVERLLASIPQELQAQAAQRCRSHARALLNFERRLLGLRGRSGADPRQVNDQFERLHEIYAELEEPDGMEGISTQLIDPSTMHRIREHESTGKWTSAQSCWEVELQSNPDNLEYHTGLLKCLRNLGHYDSMRNHILGVLHNHPEWRSSLAPFELEGCLIIGDWENVASALRVSNPEDPATVFATVAQALQNTTNTDIGAVFRSARNRLGSEVVAAGQESYRRVYDAVANLHILHELESINRLDRSGDPKAAQSLQDRLDARLQALSPTFRIQEQVLSMRRTAFRLLDEQDARLGQLWLQTAKVARKADHPQTSYSATLQAERAKNNQAFLQRVKLEKMVGLSTRALQELEREMKPLLAHKDEIDSLAVDRIFLAKSALTQARWMVEADRYPTDEIVAMFNSATALHKDWESPYYYLAKYYQDLTASLNQETAVYNFRFHTVKSYIKCLTLGSKYIYQAMPRWLTMFMDLGMHESLPGVTRSKRKSHDTRPLQIDGDAGILNDLFRRVAGLAVRSVEKLPVWQWLTVFPQVVSRICHINSEVYKQLELVMVKVLEHYPQHAVWQMGAVVHSTVSKRSRRCVSIFNKAKVQASSESNKIICAGENMVKQLLDLANYKVRDLSELHMKEHFRGLNNLAPSPMIVPLQSSLTVTLPSAVVNQFEHKPFPSNLPVMQRFDDVVEVMNSLAKPRKIVVYDNFGQAHSFLCKPHDDLRKDARLMEFNSMINKLLKKDTESRRRHLVIRTYCVLPLNEECGLIEWVPHTVGFRQILTRLWEARNISPWTAETKVAYDNLRKGKDSSDTIGKRFDRLILAKYPPVFHEWFIETFPEPSTWLRNRMAYARTAAVMSMVGFVLGLGDRHGENILFDSMTGETVHVDFNCLFDKGRTFEIAERVPFRLTQNIVAGFGITGVEGAFRRSCEITMRILRDSQDSLMSVLEAFVHDPLVEWGKKRKRLWDEQGSSNSNAVDEGATDEARRALVPIKRKLQGFQASSDPKVVLSSTTSTENQVQNLIQEATSLENLGQMYIGWAAFM